MKCIGQLVLTAILGIGHATAAAPALDLAKAPLVTPVASVILAKADRQIRCDGSTDDTLSINAALVAFTGSTLILPKGTCRISATLRIPAKTSLEGRGRGTTILETVPNPGYAAVTVEGSKSHVAHLSINGNSNSSGLRGSDGVRLDYAANHSSVYDIEVYGCADNGIEINARLSTSLYHNYIHNNFTNGIYVYGTVFQRASYVIIRNNFIKYNTIGTLKWDGIDADPSTDHVIIYRNELIGNDIILFDGGNGSGGSFNNVVRDNKIIDSPENCIDVSGEESNIIIYNNVCINTIGYGVLLNSNAPAGDQSMLNIKVQGNKILGATLDGVWIGSLSGRSGPRGVDILQNHIEDVSRGPGSAASAITLRSATRDWKIIGNVLIPGEGRYAIDAEDAGSGRASANTTSKGQTGIFNGL